MDGQGPWWDHVVIAGFWRTAQVDGRRRPGSDTLGGAYDAALCMSPITTAVRQPARRGRPCGRGVKRWHGEAVARVVRDALAARDVDDPESVTEATYRLCEAVEALLGPSVTGARDPAPAPPRGHRTTLRDHQGGASVERPHHGPGRSGARDAVRHQRADLGLTGRPIPSLFILYIA